MKENQMHGSGSAIAKSYGSYGSSSGSTTLSGPLPYRLENTYV